MYGLIREMADRRARGRYRNWVFTLNNPTPEEVPKDWVPEQVKYLVYQLEKGEKEATPHYQGYICFRREKSLHWLKENCSPRAHWEPRRGTHAEASDYCQKQDTRVPGTEPVIVGTAPRPGKRS